MITIVNIYQLAKIDFQIKSDNQSFEHCSKVETNQQFLVEMESC